MIEKRTGFSIEKSTNKSEVIDAVDKWRFNLGFRVVEINGEKPWGAYWKIKKEDVTIFLKMFFPEKYVAMADWKFNLSPKFLLVAPHEQLSWQYHERRSENWAVVAGEVGVKLSRNDTEPEVAGHYGKGEKITIGQGMRHRLVGGDGWGLVAEVWTHTNFNRPSDEEDIVRLADNYGREK